MISTKHTALPLHWKVVKLGKFVEKQKGKKPKHLSDKLTDRFNIPYVDIKAFEKNIIRQYTDGERCVLCEDDDFLIVWDGSRSGLVGKAIKGALGSTLVRINFPGVFNDYAFYFLRSKFLEINTRAKGSGTPHVDPDLLWNYDFPLPPLPEQHRIVAKIEELFSELDNGIASLQKAKAQLKTYRQAVLKWAFEGKLTEEWREKRITNKEYRISNNDEVSLVAEKRENYSDNTLPKDWEMVQLKEVTDKITDGEHFKPKTEESGIPFLSAKDVRDEGVLFDNPLYISEETAKKALQRCNPQRGDVLIVSRGATVGRMCVVNTDRQFCLLGSVILIKVNKDINSEFLNYVLKSPIANQKMITISGATAQQAIYLRDIKKIAIPLAPIEEQHQIVQEIESRFSVANKLEEAIEQSLQQAEALRQSILKQAFEGKLVVQEAEESGNED